MVISSQMVRKVFVVLLIGILLMLSGCNLPSLGGQETPPAADAESQALPAVSVGPLPPALVETSPISGSQLSLDSAITFYFNQPMEKASVEAAIQGTPALSGTFSWIDDATVTFVPAQPWAPASQVAITVNAGIASADGLTMEQPAAVNYTTADYLRLAEMLPQQATQEVDLESAIVVSFNQPVVPLGADPASLPQAITLTPEVSGRGEWLNTSTYAFYPQPALVGSTQYEVQVSADLNSVRGTSMEASGMWTFSTLTPGYHSYSPELDAVHVGLDEPVVIRFNQAMEQAAVEQAFTLVDENQQPVSGTFSWTEDGREMTFTPNQLYRRGMSYTFSLPSGIPARGGSPLPEALIRSFQAVGEMAVISTIPANGGTKGTYSTIQITFNAPIDVDDPAAYVSIEPDTYLSVDVSGNMLSVYGAAIEAEEIYTMTVSGGIADIWGDTMGSDYTFSFTADRLARTFLPAIYQGRGLSLVDPDEPLFSAQVVNVDQVQVDYADVSVEEFIYQNHGAPYDERAQFFPTSQHVSSVANLDIAQNRNQRVAFPLNSGNPVAPGVYWLSMQALPNPDYATPAVTYMVVSRVQMVLKASQQDVLVWAIDRRSNAPVVDTPVRIFDSTGQVIAQGITDNTGLFAAAIAPSPSEVLTVYAVLGAQGGEFFSMASTNWNEGISNWDFGVASAYGDQHMKYYFYTDRPIYRPGQTVYYRVAARQADNGRYQLPEETQLALVLRDWGGADIDRYNLPLSEYGTAGGSFTLPESVTPGTYSLVIDEEAAWEGISFLVAEYRKPEIDLSAAFQNEDYLVGDQLSGKISSRYFFDAPASQVPLSWNLYSRQSYFSLPGYQVGPTSDYYSSMSFGDGLGQWLVGGEAETDLQGGFTVTAPAEEEMYTQTYTLEVVMRDESGYQVANRATTTVHPAPIYIGVAPDQWLGQVDAEMGFDIQVVDWERNAAGVQDMQASFSEISWVRRGVDQIGSTIYEKQLNTISEGSFAINENGQARLSYIPAAPGLYQLEVRSGNAVTQVVMWVGGAGSPSWPDFGQNQMELQADKESYLPGEIAQVFIPNPFEEDALALITIERGAVMSSQIVQVAGSGMTFPVQLTDEEAPNVYFTATLLGTGSGGQMAFRYGIVNLPVSPQNYLLNVEVIGPPEKTSPGEAVQFTIRVTDAEGNPVQGEFSLSVVDEAVLALADPVEKAIQEAYYGEQPLGVVTGISLVANAEVFMIMPGGLGGGGGGDQASSRIRSEFEDTAYWNASVVTGADGTAQVEAVLPDNLTTWRVLARGLTKDTLVGEAVSEVVTTQPLIVQPVAPRFVVVGDHLELAAVVQNTTAQDLEVTVAIQVSGFSLDDQNSALQTVDVPANGRMRLGWWGTVEEADMLDVVFAAEGGEYSDLTTPTQGQIPIVRYLAPQVFSTAGVLDEGGERLELVSLPRSFDPEGGNLRLEMASSLAGVALDGLEALETYPYESTEGLVSRFLPNLEMYRAIQEFGLDEPALQAQLEDSLHAGIDKLEAAQTFDGGWSWYIERQTDSSPQISAYVLLGLTRAQDAGYAVNVYIVENAVRYLMEYLVNNPPQDDRPWSYDQAAFIHYVLVQADSPVLDLASNLLDQRDKLSPWAQALLGLAIGQQADDPRVATLFSDLQSTAVRSATGAHWDTPNAVWQTMSSDIFNNAAVIFALAQRDPASPLLTDAVRYLMAYRTAEGGWQSSYATSWALMALTEVMRGTAELGGEFAFSAALNDNPFAAGQAGGTGQFEPVVAETGLESLLTDLPNALTISREPGVGRLYYRASLSVVQPVESITPISRGISISRAYYLTGQDCREEDCQPVESAQVGDLVTAHVTINVPAPLHYVAVEDFIPAGTEVLDLSLKTSQIGEVEQETLYDPLNPFADGWGWWYFTSPKVYDDHVSWLASYLPAGTYELTYTIVVLQPGDFQVIPAQAQQVYFPEVQAVGAGQVFEIVP